MQTPTFAKYNPPFRHHDDEDQKPPHDDARGRDVSNTSMAAVIATGTSHECVRAAWPRSCRKTHAAQVHGVIATRAEMNQRKLRRRGFRRSPSAPHERTLRAAGNRAHILLHYLDAVGCGMVFMTMTS